MKADDLIAGFGLHSPVVNAMPGLFEVWYVNHVGSAVGHQVGHRMKKAPDFFNEIKGL